MSSTRRPAQFAHAPDHPSVASIVEAASRLTPTAIAVVAPGRSDLCYARLQAQVEDVVRSLNAFGLGRNDRIAVVLPDGPEAATAFLAIAAGAVCAPLNPSYRAEELDACLGALGAKAVVVPYGADLAARAVAEARGVPIIDLKSQADAEAGTFTLLGEERPLLAPGGPAQPEDLALILPTSGTTGRPKLVPLTHRNVGGSARNIAASLDLDPADRCLNVMPLFHVHGLIGALLASFAAGASIVCPPGFSVAEVFGWIETYRPTWYTAVPTIHQAILARAGRHAEVLAGRPLRFVRSASAPLPERVRAALTATFRAPVIEAYGMTEAAHQIAGNPLPPGERRAGSVGLPTGPMVGIMDLSGSLLAAGEVGEIVIRGATVTRGYEGDPAVKAAAFRDGWLRTGDQGYLDADGYLFISGRLKDLINRGGDKIAPAEVERVLLDHPAVAQAVTFAVSDERLGEEVASAVVLRPGSQVADRDLREFVAARLADFKVPCQVLIIDEIPVGPTGKPHRASLSKLLGFGPRDQALPESQARFRSPSSQTEIKLAELWAGLLGVRAVGLDDDFFGLGGDSLQAGRVIARVRETMRIDLPLSGIFGEASTIAKMAKVVDELACAATGGANRVVSRLVAGAAPLSSAQERLWFLQELDPDSCAYNQPIAIRLNGPLNRPALEQSLSEIVRRHESLRTTFRVVKGQLSQVVDPAEPVVLPVFDLRAMDESEREARAAAMVEQRASQPFDLTRGPLLRGGLVQLGELEQLLFLSVHHIAFDGWSLGVLFRELEALYTASLEGEPSPLEALPVQYADYARWQREWLSGDTLERQLAYWKRRLADAPPVLELPTDRPRPAIQTYCGRRRDFALSKDLTLALDALARGEGVTPYMLCLGAWQALLQRYTGLDDIVVGSPVAGRNRAELDGLIGLFVNTIVLRTDLSGDPTFRELLARVREVALGAYTHQDLPFEKLVEELRPERDQRQTPLVQVMFALQNVPSSEPKFPGLSVSPFPVEPGTAKFDLSLYLSDTLNGLSGYFEYSTDLFEAATIERFAEHFRTLLEGIVADPDQRLSMLPLFGAAERQRALVEWNATATDDPVKCTIVALFEAQARRLPDAVAVASKNQQVTYAELNRRANQLAQQLQSIGVGPDIAVGILTERSVEQVVGLLGILKAGGAYLPLEPDYPRARLTFMLEDARAQVVLTQRRFAGRVTANAARVVYLDTELDAGSRLDEGNLVARATANNLAYLIYTSGSSGAPKGVMVEHASVVNLLCAMRERLNCSDADVFLAVTSLSFDIAALEIFIPLIVGARVVLAPHDLAANLAEVEQALRVGPTIVQATPSTWQLLLATSWRGEPRPRHALSGGEVLPAALAAALAEFAGTVWNLYGPTETTIYSTMSRVEVGGGPPNIGRPIANTQLYVLDRYQQVAPIGVPGELYIGGAGLSRGYLNRAELTAARFLPDPEGGEVRTYLTGDLGRQLPDGRYVHLGRLDSQVKIRGNRVEIAEIEHVLLALSGVKQVAVVARPSGAAGQRLVAYVVADPDAVPTVRELRAGLRARLPSYMLPSRFVLLDELPLTTTGKVDRGALPEPGRGRPETGQTYVAPRTLVEKVLAGIWEQVLDLERVGIRDDFFELGGHSLLATQVLSRLRDALRIKLSLRALLGAQTVADLATVVHQHLVERADEITLGGLLDQVEALTDETARSYLGEAFRKPPAVSATGELHARSASFNWVTL